MRARRRRVSRGAAPAWAMTSPRSMNNSRSSVMPTERPAPWLPVSGVAGQLSTRLDLRDLAGGHDDDFVAGGEAAGLDAARDDAAVVEFVDRLHRQPQRQLRPAAAPASSASSASTTVGPWYQPMRGVCSATPSPSRAEIGITAVGVTPRPVRCAEISSLISLKRSALKSTRSILLTTIGDLLDAQADAADRRGAGSGRARLPAHR